MRLLDRILTEGLVRTEPNVNKLVAVQGLSKAQLVVIDNVAKYHFQELPQKLDGDPAALKATDFPNVMLPFEVAFLEMRIPQGSGLANDFSEAGVLLEMMRRGKNDKLEDVAIRVPPKEEDRAHMGKTLLNENVAYHLFCTLFVYSRDIGGADIVADFIVPVNAEGQIVSTENVFPFVGMTHDITLVDRGGRKCFALESVFLLATTYLFPCLLALSFMHCRNVKVIEEIPPEKLSKKHRKKTGKPLLRYRVLRIDHVKEILEREGKASSQGIKHALHICRGHFKTYGKDGKGLLFGKHVATVWIPMHTRGSKDEGVVVKDYEVTK
jgi:hypothetical protein